VITVNPKKSDKINAAGPSLLPISWWRRYSGLIAKFGVDKYGQPLFFADAGKKDDY